MGSGMVISLVVIAIFITVLIAFFMQRRKSRHFKQRFGPEYDRAVLEQQGDCRRAEAALANREKRVHAFPLRALSAVDISVNYPTIVQNYRAAHEIVERHGNGRATTEELRQAMVYYRSLFDELLAPDKDEFPEPAWDELYAQPNDELHEPAKEELAEVVKDELLEPAKIEEIGGKRRRVTRDRAS